MRLIFTQTIISFQKMCRINRSVAISESRESDSRIAQFDRVTMAESSIDLHEFSDLRDWDFFVRVRLSPFRVHFCQAFLSQLLSSFLVFESSSERGITFSMQLRPFAHPESPFAIPGFLNLRILLRSGVSTRLPSLTQVSPTLGRLVSNLFPASFFVLSRFCCPSRLAVPRIIDLPVLTVDPFRSLNVSVPVCCGFWHIRPSFNCEPTPSHRSPIDEVVSETSAIMFSSINTILLAFPSAFPFSVVRAEPAVDFQCGLIDSISSLVPVEVGSQFWSLPLHLVPELNLSVDLLSSFLKCCMSPISRLIPPPACPVDTSPLVSLEFEIFDFSISPIVTVLSDLENRSPKYAAALRSLPSPPHLRNPQSAETLIPLTHNQDKKLIAQQRQTAEVLVHHFNRYFF
jgi:hypothetical protein